MIYDELDRPPEGTVSLSSLGIIWFDPCDQTDQQNVVITHHGDAKDWEMQSVRTHTHIAGDTVCQVTSMREQS